MSSSTRSHADNSNSSQAIPPIAHAVGGSVGSALALLLLYPLERARIEVQTVVARLEARHAEEPPTTPSDIIGDANDKAERLADTKQAQYLSTQQSKSANNNPPAAESEELKTGTLSPSSPKLVEQFPDDNPELWACLQRIWNRGELYKGAAPLAWTLAISNFIFFFVNATVKQKLKQLLLSSRASHRIQQQQQQPLPPHWALLASCLAGSINVLFTNPLWVTNLRIISNQATYSTLAREMAHVVRTLGWSHLWQGTTASLLLVSNPVIQFFLYEQVKAWRLVQRQGRQNSSRVGDPRPNLPPAEAFLLGAAAKAVATVLTYPLQLAQAVLRMQKKQTVSAGTQNAQGEGSNKSSRGILACLHSIYTRDGMRGLYTGMNAKLLQTVLTAAFQFLSYEQILAAVYAVHKKLLQSAMAAG